MGHKQSWQKIPTEFQRLQLQLVEPALQKLNAIAALHLLRLCHFCNNETELISACSDLFEVVQRGAFLMAWCESIMESKISPVNTQVNLMVGVVCDACADRRYSKPRDYKPEVRKEASWQSQIDFYLWLTTTIAAFVLGPAASVGHRSHELINRLGAFRKLVNRQYLFLKKITPDCAPQVNIINSPVRCIHCGVEVPQMLSIMDQVGSFSSGEPGKRNETT